MIGISHPISSNGDEQKGETGGFPTGFAGGDLLDDINFDDLFVGFDGLLPDLEVDPSEILAELMVGLEEEYRKTTPPEAPGMGISKLGGNQYVVWQEAGVMRNDKSSNHGEEVMSVSKNESGDSATPTGSSSSLEISRGRKPSAVQTKGSHGKRKLKKVDWTPELHRRFVQAVEQLGVDKAVPSRILELMGVDCLTRHNIASHLQKYRTRKKHLIAREAEAASWSQRRQSTYYGNGPGRTVKRDMNHHPWVTPTMGFPRPAPVPPFRPLHVWGHPTSGGQSLVPVSPKHLVRPPAPPPPWVPQPPPPPPDPSYWHPHYPRVPATLIQGRVFPQLMPSVGFPAIPLAHVPPSPIYRPSHGVPPLGKHSDSQIQLDSHPPKESIDATIGEVLSKPWLPLPLGLKPPSLESVMVELKRKGIPNIPPSCN